MYKNFLKLNYWANSRPGSIEMVAQKYFIAFILMLALFILVTVYFKNVKKGVYLKIWRRLNSFAVTNFVISLLLLFFTYENARILSARIWFLFWVVEMIIWLWFIYKNYKKIPLQKEERIKNKEYEKYLP